MKGFTNRIFKIYNKNNKYGSFCKSKDYFENKKMRQADKARTIFRHDDSKLKNV
jgi:hypothetical protein